MNIETLSPVEKKEKETKKIGRDSIRRFGYTASKSVMNQENQKEKSKDLLPKQSIESNRNTEITQLGANERLKDVIKDNTERTFVIPDLNKDEIVVAIRAKKDGEEFFYAQRNNDAKYGNVSTDNLFNEIQALSIDDNIEDSQALIYMPEGYENNTGSEVTSVTLKSMAGLLKGSENVQFSTFKPSQSNSGAHSSLEFNYSKDGNLHANYKEQKEVSLEA